MTDQAEYVNPFEGWVPLKEAARTIGRERSTLVYWVKKGYIQAHRVGSRIKVVNLEEVKAYSESHSPHQE